VRSIDARAADDDPVGEVVDPRTRLARILASMRAALLSLALAGCVTSDLVPCGALLCAVDQACTPTGCIDRSRIDACDGLVDDAACAVDGVPGTCRDGACATQVCGDGVVEGLEECEGEQLGGATCLAFGFYDAPGLRCSSECRFETSECVGTCGDQIVNGPELCDTTPGQSLRCSDVGFDYGSVTCSEALCAPLYTACANFGWRERLHSADTPTWISSPRPGNVFLGGSGLCYRFDSGSSSLVDVPRKDCGDSRKGWVSPTDGVYVATERGVCREIVGGWMLDEIGSLYAMWGASESDIYAVGDGIYHFDGTSWSPVATNLAPGVYRDVSGRGTTVVATREDGMIAIAQNGSWTLESIGAPSELSNPWISPAGEVYVVDDDTLYRRTTSGWTTTPAPADRMRYVWGLGDNAIYAANAGGLWVFDRTSWMPVELPESIVGWAALGGSDSHLVFAQPYQRFFESSGFVWSTIDPALSMFTGNGPRIWAFDAQRIVLVNANEALYFDGARSTPYLLGQNVIDIWGIGSTLFAVGLSSLLVFDGTSWSSESWNGCDGVSRVWGEAADRVFFSGGNNVCVWDGNTVTRIAGGIGAIGMWGTAATGTYLLTSYNLRFLPPGASPTAWIELPLPVMFPVAIWGDANEIIVTFSDRRIFRRAHGATQWTQIAHDLLQAVEVMSGETNDVFAITGVAGGIGTQLVHWDGVTWDEVAAPTHMPTTPHAVFSSSAGTWLSGQEALVRMFRPR
jgi:hypothetical protein